MQTFITDNGGDFATIAGHLDNRRLNKQALEAWQIMLTLLELDPQGEHRTPRGWTNHPATNMWRGHELALYDYLVAMTKEWRHRGFSTSIEEKATKTIEVAYSNVLLNEQAGKPKWLQVPGTLARIASSHRRALLCKDYEWYSQFNWAEDYGSRPDNYVYVWETA